MKKLFAILAVMGVMTLGSIQPMMAQEEAAAAETTVVEEGGIHKEIKTKYIEGDAALCLWYLLLWLSVWLSVSNVSST